MLAEDFYLFPCLNFIVKSGDYQANSQQGLNVHMKRKHTLRGTKHHPRNCDQKINERAYMIYHSYKKANFKCVDCDFMVYSNCSMILHNGKHHTDNFECGLCEDVFNNDDEL